MEVSKGRDADSRGVEEGREKLIRLSWGRWGGRTAEERENDLVCEKARKDGRHAALRARGRLRGVKGRVKRGKRSQKGPRGGKGVREHRLIDSAEVSVWLTTRFSSGSLSCNTRAQTVYTDIYRHTHTDRVLLCVRRTRVRGYVNRMIDTLA